VRRSILQNTKQLMPNDHDRTCLQAGIKVIRTGLTPADKDNVAVLRTDVSRAGSTTSIESIPATDVLLPSVEI
jgi:hypothetical protein